MVYLTLFKFKHSLNVTAVGCIFNKVYLIRCPTDYTVQKQFSNNNNHVNSIAGQLEQNRESLLNIEKGNDVIVADHRAALREGIKDRSKVISSVLIEDDLEKVKIDPKLIENGYHYWKCFKSSSKKTILIRFGDY